MRKSIFTLTALLFAGATLAQEVRLEKKWTTDTTLRTPESVLYYQPHEILYVTNIDGGPWDDDQQGFLSKLRLDGSIETLHWVTGLSAPKGMAIIGNDLFVADMNRLVIVDIAAGRIRETIPFPGATGLNDVSADPRGKVYITDSREKKLFLYEPATKKISLLQEKLGGPNGVLKRKQELLLLDAGALWTVSTDKKKPVKVVDIAPSTDGIEHVRNQEYIVSCWHGEIFYVDMKTRQVTRLLDTRDQKLNTADIGYDPVRRILYVPTFYGNNVSAYEVILP